MEIKAIFSAILLLVPMSTFAQSPCGGTRGPIPFTEHGKWGYVSEKGVVIPPLFDAAGPFGSEGALACVGSHCGAINSSGSFVALIWERGSRPFPTPNYSEGLASALDEKEHWGYIDRTGRVVIPFQFKYAGAFQDGIARVRLGDKFFFVDKAGNKLTPEYDGAFDFHEDVAAVIVGKSVGYIRRDGSFALLPHYQSASGIDFSEGMAAIRVNEKVGFMDKNGNVVIEPKYDDVYAFSDGRAPVRMGDRWGYVDHEGNVVVPIKYEIGHMFSEGVASVRLDGKWGYIDKTGEFGIPPMFDAAMPFCGRVATVETFAKVPGENGRCRGVLLKGKHGVIDHSGKYVWRDAEEQTWRPPIC